MLGGFLLSLSSIGVSNYEAINDPQDIIAGFGDTPPEDEDFFDDRIIDFTVAYQRNSAVNDTKATKLTLGRPPSAARDISPRELHLPDDWLRCSMTKDDDPPKRKADETKKKVDYQRKLKERLEKTLKTKRLIKAMKK